LGTTASTVAQAVGEEAGRLARDEPSRDGPPHGAVHAAVVRVPTAAMVARRSGGVCGASTVQRPRGQRVRGEPRSQPRRAHWTVTDRIRWCGCGQRLGTDLGDDGSGWRAQPGESLGQL